MFRNQREAYGMSQLPRSSYTHSHMLCAPPSSWCCCYRCYLVQAAALLEAEKRKAEAEELPGANQRDAEACAANGGVKPRSDQEAEDGSHCFEILGIDIMVWRSLSAYFNENTECCLSASLSFFLFLIYIMRRKAESVNSHFRSYFSPRGACLWLSARPLLLYFPEGRQRLQTLAHRNQPLALVCDRLPARLGNQNRRDRTSPADRAGQTQRQKEVRRRSKARPRRPSLWHHDEHDVFIFIFSNWGRRRCSYRRRRSRQWQQQRRHASCRESC